MPAYVVANVRVADVEGYAEYVAQVPATIEQYGGRFLARAGRAERLEGGVEPARFVILEFPSYEQAKAWYESEEYRPLLELRQRLSDRPGDRRLRPQSLNSPRATVTARPPTCTRSISPPPPSARA